MNTKNLKAYAPKARRQFIEAVKKRAAHLGIYQHKVEPVKFEGGAALIEGRVFNRKQGEQRQQLEKRVAARGYELFLREMAYTWFNRFAAIRYMELHDYLEHGFRVLSHPTLPDSLPEILDNASDVADGLGLNKSHIIELQLAGNQEEALYRELLLGQCHHLYKIMPFMFEALDDATELLLPDNLTKTDSILKDLVNDIPEGDWNQIEVIGWLYQFYISEHKDAVIGKVVKSEDIPAATQLFTPNWIVKYLVQNSVGRQWLATYPESELKGKMEYYIEPAEQSDDVIEQLKAITPTSIDPEQIKVLDPAAGSGHILVEVYEVLREIYLERGYRLREIPELILTKNIYGLDIDDRAAQLAGFALMMKAREDDRRIFQRVQNGDVALNVYSLQSSEGLDIDKLWSALDLEDKQQKGTTGGLFDEPTEVIPAQEGIYANYLQLLNYLKASFLQAKTLGSLILIEQNKLDKLKSLLQILSEKVQGSDPAAKHAAMELLPIVNQAIVLAQQYDAVIANPPYMGSRGINNGLKSFLTHYYPKSKTDLFSSFIEKCTDMTKVNGSTGIMSPNVWLYLNSYELLRKKIIDEKSLLSLIELPTLGFKGASVQICAFIICEVRLPSYISNFARLLDIKGDETDFSNALKNTIHSLENRELTRTSLKQLSDLPKHSFVYWIPKETISSFRKYQKLSDFADVRKGLATCDDDRWLRRWYEVNKNKSTMFQVQKDNSDGQTWYPITKGGSPRKWYGNNDYLINWHDNGKNLKEFISKKYNGQSYTKEIRSENFYFREYLSWSDISSYGNFAVRFTKSGGLISTKGCGIFPNNISIEILSSILNSKTSSHLLKVVSPTISSNPGEISQIPIPPLTIETQNILKNIYDDCLKIAKVDWDSSERSYEYVGNPLVILNSGRKLIDTYKSHAKKCNEIVDEMKKLEEKNNAFVACLYGLDDVLSPTVKLKDVSLTCNIHNAYEDLITSVKAENRKQTEVFKDLLSYTIGCMMGRYSLDREGLVYAHSGNEGFKELAAEGAYKTFYADDDGIIPLASEDWFFDDDATTRLREFVLTVWGRDNLQENLEFIAEILCLHALKPKKGEGAMDTIRRYFSSQFFKDHCKTYKKRPIYWLFSSGKEKAFECLVYLHRYNEGTLSRMRTEYVTPLMGKYEHQHSSLEQDILEGSTEQKRLAEKALKDLEKKQAELRTFDEQLKHYAEMRISLDLDDGVKVNYGKFGNLLADVKNIHGVAVK